MARGWHALGCASRRRARLSVAHARHRTWSRVVTREIAVRRVRVVHAGPEQEDVRGGRGEHAGKCAGERQGARIPVDNRFPRRQ